jgi:ABC-type multidrug transport system fused ATPase/permease subunit
LTAFVFGKFIQRLSKKTQDTIADSNTIVEETLQGIQNVKAFANEKFEFKRYGNVVNDIVSIALKASRYRGAFVSFIIFGLFGSIVGVIWYGLILQSEGAISQGDLFSFILYTVFVGASFGGIADIYSQIVKAVGATENLLDIIDEEPEEIEFKETYPSLNLKGKIDFDNVSFSYPSRKDIPVLKNLSFSIEAGKQLAIVGPSGAGKSTIVSLVYRFYEPEKGTISIDGKNYSSFDLTQLRNELASVPQEVMLFGGSILENIKYGNPLATLDDVKKAAQLANAAEFIEQFPEQYDTLVGDRGIQLSGGQRQRIAIARAVLKNPKILILDEATSSLDSESEQLVQQALERLMQNRTTIVIAHRLSTIRKADQILVLENGEVKELGTHDELTSKDEGIFKRLLELQNG